MPVFVVVFMVLLLGYALLIRYYHNSWRQIPPFIPDGKTPTTRVSLVIAFRNEAPQLPTLLRALANQDFPRELLEILMVDDFSEDDSVKILETYSRSYQLPVTLIRMQDLPPGEGLPVAFKKKALDAGISQAKGKLIVTTDADCDFGPHWLSTLVRFYECTGAKFIAAPVKLQVTQKLLSLFQAIDFTTLQAITGASVYKKIHTLCNGANLAYEKNAFDEVGGFQGIDSTPSGDDMLLQYKIFKRYPEKVLYLKNTQAMATTLAQPSWKAFFQQRIRWASKATYYEDKPLIRVLVMVYLLNLGYLITALGALFNPAAGILCLSALVLKLLIEFPFVSNAAHFFGQERILKFFPLLQPLHILYTLVAGWLGQFGSFEWKGRRIAKSASFGKRSV